MYHLIQVLGAAASAICGCRCQACALKGCASGRTATIHIDRVGILRSLHHTGKNGSLSAPPPMIPLIVSSDRDEISEPCVVPVSGCWSESHKSITSVCTSYASYYLYHYPSISRRDYLLNTTTTTNITTLHAYSEDNLILLLPPFSPLLGHILLLCLCITCKHKKPAAWIAGL